MIAGLWVEAVPLRLQLGGRLSRPLPAQELRNLFMSKALSRFSM